jgi:DNA-binding SARP family transcriptional activator
MGGNTLELTLLDGFELRVGGRPVSVAPGSQRLLAYLGVCDGHAMRDRLLAALWPDVDRQRASGNLRSALWRLPRSIRHALAVSPWELRLDPALRCDAIDFLDLARRLVHDPEPPEHVDLRLLDHELLPSWYDEWVLVEQDRFLQLRMRALERLSAKLSEAGRYAEAIDAALAAIALEPLRESSHWRLIEAHVGEGNHDEAIRHYQLFRHLLVGELGLEPSWSLRQLAHVPAGVGR